MSAAGSRLPIGPLIDKMLAVVELRRSMSDHLSLRVLPHLDGAAHDGVAALLVLLRNGDAIMADLACCLDNVMADVRAAISAGTREERVEIDPRRLVGCTEAHDKRRVRSPAAEALHDALPLLERLARATHEALDYAEAVRISQAMMTVD
ncbi:hypothetical protein [Jannaschia donghaensis]|uniref:Uncharacterized protein n=1 Tax=Jannaschia donghaensis TaxID=420998 RepID=A0A0M6YG88_9RHOB|nr:hypothetical protein [Jannaschia donghaensis]CTQ48096.1 hypothetical protein JDO7802_00098 [Jannaschia donghaensis]